MSGRAISLALVVLGLSAAPAAGQYFGRNKVQYEDFEFRVLATEHFDIHYYPAERDAAVQAARMAERWYGRLSRALDHAPRARAPIVLYASHAHFSQTTVVQGLLPEGVGGFTDHRKGRVVLPFAQSLGETDHVLGHEIVHAFQRDLLREQGTSLAFLPLWFVEGMAEFLTIGAEDPHTAMWVRDAADRHRLPTLGQLGDPRWFPYRYGQALWAHLAERYGADVIARAMASRAPGGALGRLTAVTGRTEAQLTEEWHEAARAAARRVLRGNRTASDPPQLLVGADARRGQLNVGPSLSPDGHHLVFLSERNGYSVDLFLADAETGQVQKALVSGAGRWEIDSLQFIDSTGAWDGQGRRFALSTLQQGSPVLTLFAMPSGSVERERRLDDLDQVRNPTWSPDGKSIAFSALAGGTSDLYVLDLDTDVVRRLTTDHYADLQPAWSPDGRTIAFVTDRFTSSLGALTFGPYRLAALDVASGDIRALPFIAGAKHIDPQWAGDDLYFVADASGVSNVFRMALAQGGGAMYQITDVASGVSGVTALSPALSVAPEGGMLAFSVYRDGRYEIERMALAGGTPYGAGVAAGSRAALATGERTEPAGHDWAMLRPTPGGPGAAAGLAAPEAAGYERKPYRSRLALDRIGEPYLSAGSGAFGGFFRAGVAISFSDLLEEQRLQTAVQVGGRLRDFAVQTSYVNRRSRWTWGLVGGQVPIAYGASRVFAGDAAQPLATRGRETLIVHQTHRQMAALAAYPFSRARRLELSAGLRTMTFDYETTTRMYSAETRRLIEERITHGKPPGVALVETAAALVFDSSVAGPTAPVLGTRSRFEVAPTLGEIAFVTVTADYRRYLMPVRPLTLAVRTQHAGRYGPGAGDTRLLPLAWTLRNLVRGYSLRDLGTGACAVSPQDCPTIAGLGARQLVVSNVELRLPLVGPFGRLSRSSGLPVDGFLFADGGAFAARPAGRVGPTMLYAAGAGVRLNAGGFVFEFDLVRPLTGASRGWTVAVNFRPGF